MGTSKKNNAEEIAATITRISLNAESFIRELFELNKAKGALTVEDVVPYGVSLDMVKQQLSDAVVKAKSEYSEEVEEEIFEFFHAIEKMYINVYQAVETQHSKNEKLRKIFLTICNRPDSLEFLVDIKIKARALRDKFVRLATGA